MVPFFAPCVASEIERNDGQSIDYGFVVVLP
jgi:hypothetical protein